jgi:MFS transporter, DHA1 family, multidrug resistance protein B
MLLLNMNKWYFVIATIVFSLGEIIYSPPSQAILSKLAEGSETSKYLAFENLIVKGSVFLGSIGVYLGSYSEKLVISFIVLLGLLSIIFYVPTNKKIPQMNN